MESIPSRWLLTSGREEKVSDGQPGVGSPFARSLCEFLESNQEAEITSGELFSFVLKNTSQRVNQQPIAGHIENCGHEGGMLLFRKTSPIKRAKHELEVMAISCETAIELKRLGVHQKSLFSYFDDGTRVYFESSTKLGNKLCSAFLAQELHEMIPERIPVDTNTFIAHQTGYDQLSDQDVEKYDHAIVTVQRTSISETPYMAICRCANRMVAFSITKEGKYNNLICWGRNQADAIGGMIIELIKEGKI